MTVIKNDKKIAKVLKFFLSNIAGNLKILEYSNVDQLLEHFRERVLKAIVKYKQHQSIVAIKQKYNSKSRSTFFCNEKIKINKEIDMLQVNKTVQMTDIPANIIKENSDLVSGFIF